MVLQTWIFWLSGWPEIKVGLYYKSTFFQVGEKWFCKLGFFFWLLEKWLTRKKIRVWRTTFLEPLSYTFLEKWLQIRWLQGCQKKYHHSLNKLMEVWCAKIEPKLKKIRKTVRKQAFSTIFWHPLDPWGHVHSDLDKNSVRTGCVM